MITERITINEKQFVILLIDETTNKVYQIEVHSPNSLLNKATFKEPMGISKEEALQIARRKAQEMA